MSFNRQSTIGHRQSRMRGLSLVEFLLALAITGLVASGVAAMMVTASYGTRSRNDLRGLVVKEKITSVRLAINAREATMVLDKGADYLILWMGDTRADGVPNPSEIKLIERDSATSRVTCYAVTWPVGFTQAQIDAADVQYPLGSTNFRTTTTALKSQAYFPGELWATSVTAMSVTVNNASVQAANLVAWRLTFSVGTMTDTAIGAAALRN